MVVIALILLVVWFVGSFAVRSIGTVGRSLVKPRGERVARGVVFRPSTCVG